MNNCTLLGRLTKDPELKTTPNGTNFCRFTIAVKRNYTTKEGETTVDFIDIMSWKGKAEFVSKYFNKGKIIYVIGNLYCETYTDNEGNKRRNTYINASELGFAGDSNNKLQSNQESKEEFQTELSDDLPF